METLGFLSFMIIVMFWSSYASKIKQLESKIKKLEKPRKGENNMSKIISELPGKKCNIFTDGAYSLTGKSYITCDVLEADDEWIKISFEDKKKTPKTKIIRIDSVDSVELLSD